jgi:phosphomannomutase
MLYFAAATLGVDGGIMVTGSHNPPDDNGFKMVMGGKPFHAEAIQQLGAIAETLGAPAVSCGTVEENSVFDDYVARILGDYARSLKVAWDPGNGSDLRGRPRCSPMRC